MIRNQEINHSHHRRFFHPPTHVPLAMDNQNQEPGTRNPQEPAAGSGVPPVSSEHKISYKILSTKSIFYSRFLGTSRDSAENRNSTSKE